MSWWRWEPKVAGTITGVALRIKLERMCPGALVVVTDREYQIPEDPADVTLRASPANLPYVRDSRDCDDFVRMARGWLSRKNLGNLLVMDCAIKKTDGSKHALLAFMCSSGIILGEPQTGRIVTYRSPIKIYRLIA